MISSFKKSISIVLALLIAASLIIGVPVSSGAVSSGNVIYFEKPESWGDTVYIYYWEGSPKPSGLQDYKMENIGGNIYSYTAKASFNEFLFNDGTHQTKNVSLPSSGKMCRVLSTGSKNDWGNFCNDAEWVDFEQPSIGLSVKASPKSCDFVGSIEVTLSVTETPSGTYKINNGSPVQYTDGTKITLGADAQVGDVIKLDLAASADGENASESYTYTKVSTPSASSLAYFDNSAYNWEDVYIYAYGTKELAEWPGVKMQQGDDGLYYYAFTSAYKNENIIFNNGKAKDDGKEQYPANSGLPLNAGECKMLTAEKEWVSYGTPDSKPAGFAYTASGTAFSSDSINVKIGLKNAVKGTYRIDDGSEFEYTDTTTVTVGQGKIGNSTVKLTLTAENDKGVKTSTNYTYKKTFTPSKTTFSSPTDGHTTEAIGGHYGTNPNMQLGKNKTITVDGNPSDWDSSMIIAQGVANDDPRVYMPSSMHEQPWDDYALYAAWDDDNLYFMWEMANTTYVVSPSDNFAASQEARPWRNSIPMYLALSINPEIHADGKAWGTDKTGTPYTNPFVWGCDGGTAKDGGVGFKTKVDTLIAFDTNNSNGGSSIFKADHYDEATDNYLFNYDTRIPIGVTSYELQDNQNGFKIAKDYGTLSTSLYGVGGAKGSHTIGDSLDENSNWVDFFDLGYKQNHGFIYEVAVPLEKLGIDKNYIETNGIGAMQILTYGTSGMDCLPYDATMQDSADVEYSYDPSTSHEKEDIDEITVPLARVGALLSNTTVNEAPFEVNFGADKAGTQGIGTTLNLKAEPYNGTADYTYDFTVNGVSAQNSAENTYSFTPSEKGVYTIGVTVTDGNNKTVKAEKTINIGDEAPAVTEPSNPTNPSSSETTSESQSASSETTPSSSESQPSNPSTSESKPTTPTTEAKTTITAKAKAAIYVGDTTTVTVNVKNKKGTTTFTTSNKKVATVSSKGVVKGIKAGTVTITAKNNGAKATVRITIKQKPIPKPSLKSKSVSLKAGATATIKVLNAGGKAIKYKSSNKKIATVTSKGKVTALKKGSVKIAVTVGNTKLSYKVKVKSNPTLKINGKNYKKSSVYSLQSGKNLTVKITGKAANVKNAYSTTNKKIAKVTSNAKAKTVKIKGTYKGKATVTIKVNGVAYKIKVNVVYKDYILDNMNVGEVQPDGSILFKTQNDTPSTARALCKLLEGNKKRTIILPKKKINIERVIHIGNNKTIIATGATVFQTKSDTPVIINDCKKTNYSSLKNLSITGGTWQYKNVAKAQRATSTFRFAHGQNIKLKNCRVDTNYVSHAVELIACKNVTISNCKLEAQGKQKNDKYAEPLQIDIATKATAPTLGGKFTNGAVCQNITVEKCTVKGSRGICTNKTDTEGGKWLSKHHSNIKIIGCTVTGMATEALCLHNVKGVTVKNNTVYSKGGDNNYNNGCFFASFGNDSSTANYKNEFSGNTIKGGIRALYIQTYSANKHGATTIKNNKLYAKSGAGNALSVSNCKKVISKNNKTYKW